jgi:hypothetical protein
MKRGKRARWAGLVLAMLVVVAVGASSAAVGAPAPQTSVSISGQADWISLNQINVYVTVSGTGGTGFLNVQVVQARPPFAGILGGGGRQIICDGQRRVYPVNVFQGGPGWHLGEAEAFASAFCPTSGSAEDTQTIRITKP